MSNTNPDFMHYFGGNPLTWPWILASSLIPENDMGPINGNFTGFAISPLNITKTYTLPLFKATRRLFWNHPKTTFIGTPVYSPGNWFKRFSSLQTLLCISGDRYCQLPTSWKSRVPCGRFNWWNVLEAPQKTHRIHESGSFDLIYRM